MEELEKIFVVERNKLNDDKKTAMELEKKYLAIRTERAKEIYEKLAFLERYGIEISHDLRHGDIYLFKEKYGKVKMYPYWMYKKLNNESYFWCDEKAIAVDWQYPRIPITIDLYTDFETLVKMLQINYDNK